MKLITRSDVELPTYILIYSVLYVLIYSEFFARNLF